MSVEMKQDPALVVEQGKFDLLFAPEMTLFYCCRKDPVNESLSSVVGRKGGVPPLLAADMYHCCC